MALSFRFQWNMAYPAPAKAWWKMSGNKHTEFNSLHTPKELSYPSPNATGNPRLHHLPIWRLEVPAVHSHGSLLGSPISGWYFIENAENDVFFGMPIKKRRCIPSIPYLKKTQKFWSQTHIWSVDDVEISCCYVVLNESIGLFGDSHKCLDQEPVQSGSFWPWTWSLCQLKECDKKCRNVYGIMYSSKKQHRIHTLEYFKRRRCHRKYNEVIRIAWYVIHNLIKWNILHIWYIKYIYVQ